MSDPFPVCSRRTRIKRDGYDHVQDDDRRVHGRWFPSSRLVERHDLRERLGGEAGAPHQRAVDVLVRHQGGGIARLGL
jgi:hypothetical protein